MVAPLNGAALSAAGASADSEHELSQRAAEVDGEARQLGRCGGWWRARARAPGAAAPSPSRGALGARAGRGMAPGSRVLPEGYPLRVKGRAAVR